VCCRPAEDSFELHQGPCATKPVSFDTRAPEHTPCFERTPEPLVSQPDYSLAFFFGGAPPRAPVEPWQRRVRPTDVQGKRGAKGLSLLFGHHPNSEYKSEDRSFRPSCSALLITVPHAAAGERRGEGSLFRSFSPIPDTKQLAKETQMRCFLLDFRHFSDSAVYADISIFGNSIGRDGDS
jgi:hypothetical protein